MDCVDIDLAACLQQTVARSSFEPDTECNEHQPDICTVRLIAVYLDSPCRKDKNNGYRSKLNQSSRLLAVVAGTHRSASTTDSFHRI